MIRMSLLLPRRPFWQYFRRHQHEFYKTLHKKFWNQEGLFVHTPGCPCSCSRCIGENRCPVIGSMITALSHTICFCQSASPFREHAEKLNNTQIDLRLSAKFLWQTQFRRIFPQQKRIKIPILFHQVAKISFVMKNFDQYFKICTFVIHFQQKHLLKQIIITYYCIILFIEKCVHSIFNHNSHKSG